MDNIKEKVVLITGGCQGLGKEIAKLLSDGNKLVITSNVEQSLCETSTELKCDYYLCDITDSTQVIKMIDEIITKYGKIDILINNAGVWCGGELTDTSYSDIAKVSFVNIVGTQNITKEVVKHMKDNKSGKILNIVSIDALETKTDRSIYISSKFAISGFTRSLRKELQKYNIGVYGIYPGLIKTNLFKNASSDRDMTYAMEASDVANVVKYVLSFDNIVFEEVAFRKIDCPIY